MIVQALGLFLLVTVKLVIFLRLFSHFGVFELLNDHFREYLIQGVESFET